jgi:Cys-tRNA(Pro)/Cys-tRNA(Cys) deacylase
MPVVNNITRLLDQRHIVYTAYELPTEKLGALETSRLLGIPAEKVFKTIVVTRPVPGSKPILAIIPGNSQVDLKALAAFLKEKKIHLPTQREAETLTGMQAGGISPLGLINHGFQILLDQSAQQFKEIHISGGQRGLNIRLPVKELVKLTGARLAAISSPSDEDDGE